MRRDIKEFKTLNEQIEILKNKGLTIDDEYTTKQILLKESYFFLSGYRHIFLRSPSDKRYIMGTTFEEQYALFVFDRHFRNIIFKNLLVVETNIKSIFSYQLSKKYGYKEKDYLRIQNFSNDPTKNRQISDLISKMKRQIRVNGRQHSATIHYLSNYGYIPLWVLVKVLSFGIVSEMYSILKPDDQLAIAQLYNLDVQTLELYLALLANYRNLCAHEDILYDHRTQRCIDDTKYHQLLNVPLMNNEYIYGKNDLFALIIILKQLLSVDEFSLMAKEIDYEIQLLGSKIMTIPMSKIIDRIGLPNNWLDIINL